MIKRQVLVVVGNPEISQPLQICLERSAIEVDCAEALSKALGYMMKKRYCLIIIDLQMSCINHEELIRIFRTARHTPILVLTDTLAGQEKIDLFCAGAYAFLEKPVDADVCAAQANALIKLYLESDEELGKSVPIVFGTFLVIAPRYRKVLVQGMPLELTRIEFDLLHFMAKHPGQVFSRRELYHYVWDDYYELGGDETVKSHIKTLRKKFAGLGRNVIETVWGVGYRFVPPKEDG